MSTHRDERTIATHQRWAARGMAMLMIALSIDLIVRSLILKQDPRQYLDIGLLWMATMLYVSIGMAASGVAPFGGKWSTTWLVILIITAVNAVVISVFLTLKGMIHTLAHFIFIMIAAGASAFAGVFLTLFILRGIYAGWERLTLGRGPREE